MPTEMPSGVFNEQLAEFAFFSAASNWTIWRKDFEFTGKPTRLPVLVDEGRFLAFVAEYGVLRGIKDGKRKIIRENLSKCDKLDEFSNEKSDNSVDKTVEYLEKNEIYKNVKRSFVSKIFAFAYPETFVAWDKYVRLGVSYVEGGSRNYIFFLSYSDFLKSFNRVLENELGGYLKEFTRNRLERSCLALPDSRDSKGAFVRRVLDVYLMALGGRWENLLRNPAQDQARATA